MTEKPESALRGEATDTGKGQTSPEDRTANDGTTSSDGGGGDGNEKTTPFTQWPWLAQFFLALVIIIAVVVLLVGLPTASMLVAKKMSSGSELSGTVSFWGALFAAFISLVVTFIAGVFAFTAFKVEGNAAQEARRVAKEESRDVAKSEARKTAKKECAQIIGDAAYEYIREEIEVDGEKEKQSIGEKMVREASDGYVKDQGPKIILKAADVCAKNYMERNGAGITRGVADDYIREAVKEGEPPRGDKIAEQVANAYMHHKGAGITRGVADNYIREAVEEGEPPRGDKITRQSADAYVHHNGAGITREAADGYIREDVEQEGETLPRGDKVARQAAGSYVRGVVDDYAGEDIEGEGLTRVEKMAREVVKTTGADEFARLVDARLAPEIARLVDEYLASLSFVDRLRIGSRRAGRHDRPDASGNDKP